jgi:hypothetical protein
VPICAVHIRGVNWVIRIDVKTYLFHFMLSSYFKLLLSISGDLNNFLKMYFILSLVLL